MLLKNNLKMSYSCAKNKLELISRYKIINKV